MAVPRARLACPVRSFGWGRRTWASKVLPREGLRPQMHRGAGAHCVTARPVLVERNTAAPSPGRRGGVGGAGSSRGCVSAGEWCPEHGAGSKWAERRGRCVGLRVQRTGSLRHACFPLPRALSGALWDTECRQTSSRAPFLRSPGAPFCRERWCSYNKSIRLEASGDYPPNLSISLSGGKEINRDLLSSGERTGASPALNRGPAHAGREMWGEGLPAHPRGRGRAPHVEASARRPRTPHQRG